MGQNPNFAKRIILDFLDYMRYKVENDKLTLDEADSIAKTLEGGLNLTGTIDDLATFYGQSKTNVKSVICRKLISKPIRRVYYSFNSFRKVVPASWLAKRK
jgi:hypothetical protein